MANGQWLKAKGFLPLNAIKDKVRLPLRAQARMPLNATKKEGKQQTTKPFF